MRRRWNSLLKKAAPLFAGVTLLQAGGCGVDPTTIATEWLTLIANDAISGFVFRNFNLVA